MVHLGLSVFACYMSHKKKKKSLAKPEDILSGQYSPKIEELFEVIHRVNPTGDRISPEAKERAYSLKAALQSLLIERFGEFLEVFPMGGREEEVVGIRHRTYMKNACHAAVQRLSPTAREWVYRRLREGSTGASRELWGEPAPFPQRLGKTPAPLSGAQALIAQGDSALGEFDFEKAREKYRQALAHPEAGKDDSLALRAARSLLVLLVDHLADDEGARELSMELPSPCLEDGEIRGLVGLALARLGDIKGAMKWVTGYETDRAVEVYLECARNLLRKGDLEECGGFLARVPSQGEYSAAKESLLRALREKQAQKALPLEKELARALETGDQPRAESLARQILQFDPENHRAHEVLRLIREKKEKDKSEETLGKIEECLAAGKAGRADALYKKLEGIKWARENLPLEKIAARISRTKKEENRKNKERQVENLRAGLGFPLTAKGLEAYLRAPEEIRKAFFDILQTSPEKDLLRRALLWIEDSRIHPEPKNLEETVRAVNFLTQEEKNLSSPRGEKTWELLAPFKNLLERSSRGKRLLKQAYGAWKAARAQKAEKVLAEAESLGEKDIPRLEELMASLDKASLDAKQRERVRLLEDNLAKWNTIARLRAAVKRTDPRTEPFTRIFYLEELARSLPEEEAQDLYEQQNEIFRYIHATWIEETAEGDAVSLAPGSAAEAPIEGLYSREEDTWVYLAEQSGPRIFLRFFSENFEHNFGVVLKPPVPMRLICAGVEDDALLLGTDRGILRIFPGEDFFIEDFDTWPPDPAFQDYERGFFLQGSRYLWLYKRGGPERDGRFQVFDTEKKEFCAKPKKTRILLPLPGTRPPLCLSSFGNDIAFLDPSGRLVSRYNRSLVLAGAASHPEENKVLAVVVTNKEKVDSYEFSLDLMAFTRDGKGTPLFSLGESKDLECVWVGLEGKKTAAAAKEKKAAFFITPRTQDYDLLVAASGDLRKNLWIMEVPKNGRFILDQEGKKVFFRWEDEGVDDLVPLGPEIPNIYFSKRKSKGFPDFLLKKEHSWTGEKTARRRRFYLALLSLLDNKAIIDLTRKMMDRNPPAADLKALATGPLPEEAKRAVLERLSRHHKNDSFARLILAHHAVQKANYQEALETLPNFLSPDLLEEQQQHAGHVRTLALLGAGRWKDAEEQAKKSLRLKGACSPFLKELVNNIKFLRKPYRKLRKKDPVNDFPSFISSVRLADEKLKEKDWLSAVFYLECLAVWAHPHIQVLARLTHAYLSQDSTEGLRADYKFRARRVFNDFLLRRFAPEPEFPLGPLEWPEERLASLEKEALQWLGDSREKDYPPSGLEGKREPDPFFGEGRPLNAYLVPLSAPTRDLGGVLGDDRHTARLRQAVPEIQRLFRTLNPIRAYKDRVGFLVDAGHEDFPVCRAVSEFLLGRPASKEEVVLPLTKDFALRYFSTDPRVYRAFLAFHKYAFSQRASVFAILHPEGVTFVPCPP